MTVLVPYGGVIPDKATQTKDEFANNIHPYLNYYNNSFIPQLNAFAKDAVEVRDVIHGYTITNETYKNDTLDYKNTAYTYMSRAEDAAKRAEAVVIPEEATYSIDAIDALVQKQRTELFLGFDF